MLKRKELSAIVLRPAKLSFNNKNEMNHFHTKKEKKKGNHQNYSCYQKIERNRKIITDGNSELQEEMVW